MRDRVAKTHLSLESFIPILSKSLTEIAILL